jgi:hypothetical protein
VRLDDLPHDREPETAGGAVSRPRPLEDVTLLIRVDAGPLSTTATQRQPPSRPAARRTTDPAGARRTALSTRLLTARLRASRSAATTTPGRASATTVSERSRAAPRSPRPSRAAARRPPRRGGRPGGRDAARRRAGRRPGASIRSAARAVTAAARCSRSTVGSGSRSATSEVGPHDGQRVAQLVAGVVDELALRLERAGQAGRASGRTCQPSA